MIKDLAFVLNPERYYQLWPVEPEIDEERIDWIVPETEGEVGEMMAALREVGVHVDPGLTS